MRRQVGATCPLVPTALLDLELTPENLERLARERVLGLLQVDVDG